MIFPPVLIKNLTYFCSSFKRPHRRSSLSTHQSGSRSEISTPHLWVQTYKHNRISGARRKPVPVPLHYRVQSDLCGYPVRHVEEHQPTALPGHSVCHWASGQAAPTPLQALPPPLLGRLRASSQGAVCRHPRVGTHHHFTHPVLRFDLPSWTSEIRCDGADYLWTVSLWDDNYCNSCRNDSGKIPLTVPIIFCWNEFFIRYPCYWPYCESSISVRLVIQICKGNFTMITLKFQDVTPNPFFQKIWQRLIHAGPKWFLYFI